MNDSHDQHRAAPPRPATQRRSRGTAFALFILLLPISAVSSSLFEDDTPLNVTISGPLGELFETVKEFRYLQFSLEVDGVSVPITMRLRGHSRLSVCDFPPLRLKFDPQNAEGSVFAGQDKLKLVTHCRNYDRGEQDMLEEFAAYRIWNVLTDASYRVRMLRIRYQDTNGRLPDKGSERYGFVVESRDDLAGRMGAAPATLAGVPLKRHDLEHAALMYVFQYLIANTDWALVKPDYGENCCHNVHLFERDSQVIVIPYDFDLSGLVNAKYAFPDSELRLEKVTQRLFRGICTDRELLRGAIRTVKSREPDILAVVRDVPGMSPANIDRAVRYLAKFFKQAKNEEKMLRTFERQCI